jgi:hypothetical protein
MPALSEPVPPEPVVPYDAYPAAGTELPAEPSTAKKKSHLVGIVVVVAILLLGLVGGGLLVRQRIKAKRQAEQLVRQAQAALPTAPVTLAPVSETVSLDEKTKDTMGRMNAILTAVETFNGVNKKLPVSLLDLGKVMNDPATRSDAWGSPFIFLVDLSNNTFVFRSAGPDGKRDTADDIVVSDDTLTQWREQHHEVLDEWRVANLDLFQKLSGEQISSETKAALEKKKLEREKAKADAAAQQAAQLAAQQRQQQELRKQQEAAAAQAELQRQQEEARRRIEEERQQRERAEAERKARMEQMNFVETFEMNLRRWAAASFQAVTEKGKPGMRIVGFGVVRDAGDWENYTAILDVKIQKEAVNFIVRARDRQNFYFLKLTDDKTKDYPKNSLIKYIYLGGKYVTGPGSGEAQGAYAVIPLPFKIKQNDASHVVISVSGNTIRTSINGQLVDAWQDNTFKQGSFGFNCSDKEQATVTSFQMKSN